MRRNAASAAISAGVLSSREQVASISSFKQYGKGALQAIADAVQTRASEKLEEALTHAGDKALVNDKVVSQLDLFQWPSAGEE